MSAFTAREKLACAQRELGLRNSVYRRRVVDGKLSKAEAEREIGLMAAIAEDDRQAAATEADPSDLFRRGQTVPANDRGLEPIGDVAGRIVRTLEGFRAEDERRSSAAAELDREAKLLLADIRKPVQREAAE